MTLMRTLGSANLKLPDSVFQRLDSLLTQAESAQKDADRAEVLALAEQYVVDEAIVVPIVESAVCYAARPVMDNVTFSFSSRVLDLAVMGKTGD